VKGCLAVYVPAPDVDLCLAKGSGIVGVPLLEWWRQQGEDPRDTDRTYPEDSESDRVVIDFEGAIYGQVNMATWADRLLHAAGRHVQVYPTTARQVVHASSLVQVGLWVIEDNRVVVPCDPEGEALRCWLDVKDLEPEMLRS
jgi:hypothetical protein